MFLPTSQIFIFFITVFLKNFNRINGFFLKFLFQHFFKVDHRHSSWIIQSWFKFVSSAFKLCLQSVLFYPSIKPAIGSKISVSEHILLNKFSLADNEILPPIILLSSMLTASSCTRYLGSLILFISVL